MNEEEEEQEEREKEEQKVERFATCWARPTGDWRESRNQGIKEGRLRGTNGTWDTWSMMESMAMKEIEYQNSSCMRK